MAKTLEATEVSQFETVVTMLRNAKRIPLLGEEGWLRIKKIPRSSFKSADGVVSPE